MIDLMLASVLGLDGARFAELIGVGLGEVWFGLVCVGLGLWGVLCQ